MKNTSETVKGESVAVHTPGPWKIGSEHTSAQDEIECQNGTTIAVVWTRRGYGPRPCFKDNPEGISNARLIAAAPDLLEACKVAMDFIDSGNSGKFFSRSEVNEVVLKLQAAHHKATGGDK